MKTILAMGLCYVITFSAQAQQSAKDKLIVKLNSTLKKFEGRSFSDGETLYIVKKQTFTTTGFHSAIDIKKMNGGTFTKLKAKCEAIPWASFASCEAESSQADKEIQEITAEFKYNLQIQAVLNGSETYNDEINTITLYTTKKDLKYVSSLIGEMKKLGK